MVKWIKLRITLSGNEYIAEENTGKELIHISTQSSLQQFASDIMDYVGGEYSDADKKELFKNDQLLEYSNRYFMEAGHTSIEFGIEVGEIYYSIPSYFKIIS